jgi:AAA15 family ATPase/GTPase
MSNFINQIKISNFKSIRSCEISECKRINLFIGRPNVGKSNILEALSLFSIPYLKENSSKKLSGLIRLENETELFYNGNQGKKAYIETNIGECYLGYGSKEGLLGGIHFFNPIYSYHLAINDKLLVKGRSNDPVFDFPIKKYTYKQDVVFRKSHAKYLIPPFGYNLLSIIEEYNDLKKQVIELFKEYRLELAFDKSSQTIKIIQDNKDGLFLIPYNSIADTLQRIIFYKTAIASNNNSILLFEEPEAHSFPPYMTHLTQEMIYKDDNQFFIATHSPFILNDLLENAREELAVFIVHYEQHETKVRQLSRVELHNIFQNGVDLFTNSESFI